jgi:hypothetical protein
MKNEESGAEDLAVEMSKKGNTGLRILLVTSGLGTLVLGLLAPYYVIYVQNLGGSIELAGASLAAFSIASGVLILAFSVWESSVKDQRKLYAVGLLLRSCVFFMYIFISSFYELILTQILLGISVALVNPTFDSLFTKHLTIGKAISDWGGWEGMTAIIAGVAALSGGFVIQHFGFAPMFSLMAFVALGTGVLVLMLPKGTL